MKEAVPEMDLMRYLDGEMPPEERRRFEDALARSTELQRELALFRALKDGLRGLELPAAAASGSVWDRVSTHLFRPAGWAFLAVGLLAWLGYGIHVFATSPIDPWRRLAVAAVAIGVLLLFASVIRDRMRAWGTDPYRHVRR